MANDTNMQINISAINDTSSGFDSMMSGIENIQESIDNMTSAFTDMSESMVKSMQGATEAADTSASAIEDMGKAAQTAGEQTFTGMTDGLEAVQNQADATAQAIADIGNASPTGGQETMPSSSNDEVVAPSSEEVVAAPVGGSGGSMGSMGMMMAGMQIKQAVAPIQNALESAISSFATFDQSMRMVNEEAKLSQSGFEGMETSVIDLSNATGLSASDLSTGLYNIMSTGLVNAAGGMQVLTAAAEGAKAGNASLGDTTKALDSVMGAYGMKASSVGTVLDIMFKATNDGQMKFTDLAKSVGASATSAAMAGVSYQELAASQATLTNVGKNAAVASQQLNSLIMGIIAPTAGATKEAKSLGIEWDAGALKAHGLSYMINEATKAAGGNLDTLHKLVPNVRAFTTVVALGTTAHALYVKTLKDMSNASGSTASALKQASQGMGDSVADLKNDFTNAGMQLVIALEPAILSVIKFLEGLATWFEKLSPTMKAFIGIFAAIVVVVGSIVAPLMIFIGVLGMVAAAVGVSILVIGGIIAAVIAVIAIVAAVIANWGKIKPFFENLWKDVIKTFDNVKKAIPEKLAEWWTAIKTWFESMPGKIKAEFIVWGVAISNWFEQTKKDVIIKLGEWWTAIHTWFANMPGKIEADLETWGTAIVAWEKEQNKENIVQFTLWGNDIIKWFTSIPSKMSAQLTTWGKSIDTWFKNTKTNIETDLNNWWISIGMWFDITKYNIETKLNNWWISIYTWFENTKKNIPIELGKWWNAMGAWFVSTKTNIQNGLDNWWTTIKDWFAGLAQKPQIKNAGVNVVQSMIKGVNSQKADFSEELGTLVVDGFAALLVFAGVVIISTARVLIQDFIKGLEDLGPLIRSGMDWIGTQIANFFRTLPSEAIGWGEDLINGLIKGLKSSAAGSLLGEVAKLTLDVLNAFHEGFNEHSPSKATEIMGVHLISGLINGMSKSNIGTFIKKWAGSAVGVARGVFSTITNLSGDASSWLMSALQMTGTPTSWAPAMETLMSQESGGNPTAHNPSGATGIAQMMPGTFASNIFGSLNNILNPIDNLCASIDYIKKEYGSPNNIKGLGTSAYKGYAQGTPIGGATAGLHWVGENGAELLNFKGGESVTPMSRMAMAGGNKGSTNFNIVVNANGNVTKNETDLANMIQGKIWDKLKSSGKF